MRLTGLRRLMATEPLAIMRAVIRRIKGDFSDIHPTPPSEFDKFYGIDAGGFIGWRSLRSGRDNDAFNAGYLATDPERVRKALFRIDSPEQYSFVDIGCGKGRAMVLASEFPFEHIIGVEIAPLLVEAALRNIDNVRLRFPDRPPVRVIHCDAATFAYPLDPLIVFIAHPFGAPVMRRLVDTITETLISMPRELVIIYFNPKLASILDGAAMLERVDPAFSETPSITNYVMWRTRSPRPRINRSAVEEA